MWASSQLFRDIIRPCTSCDVAYDMRLHAPYILPCSHTFCLMCLSKEEQLKKRHCFDCQQKYSKFSLNVSLLETVKRLDERRTWFDTQLRRCDECDVRVPMVLMRRCQTCEAAVASKTEQQIDCILCLECCVNSHNGHEVRKVAVVSVRKDSSSSSPSGSLKSRSDTSRSPSLTERNSVVVTVKDVRSTLPKRRKSLRVWISNALRSLSTRTCEHDMSQLLQSSGLSFDETQIVEERSSPFYCDGKVLQMRHSGVSSSYLYHSNNSSTQSSFVHSSMDTLDGSPKLHCISDSSTKDTISIDSVFERRCSRELEAQRSIDEFRSSNRQRLTPSQPRSRIRMGVANQIQQSLSHHRPLRPCVTVTPNFTTPPSAAFAYARRNTAVHNKYLRNQSPAQGNYEYI